MDLTSITEGLEEAAGHSRAMYRALKKVAKAARMLYPQVKEPLALYRAIRQALPAIDANSGLEELLHKALTTPWAAETVYVSACPVCGANEQLSHTIETYPGIEVWKCANGHSREIPL